jgi:hypothetical protein
LATPLALVELKFNKNPRLETAAGFCFNPHRQPHNEKSYEQNNY